MSDRIGKKIARSSASALALALFLQPSTVLAQAVTYDFAIGTQNLADALAEFARTTQRQLVFDGATTRGQQTGGLRGNYSAEAGLKRLLDGTDFSYRTGQGGLLIVQGKDSAVGESGDNSSAAAGDPQSAVESADIIVTAQRRDERLIDTPISIGVLSGQDLDRGSSRGVTDVLTQIGGVSLLEGRPGSVQIAIRGIISSQGAATSAVGYYMDEVPFAFINTAELPDTNAFDLNRVEVLRGPQGTLFGANALGGVVRVLTNDADVDNFEAKGRARVAQTKGGDESYSGDVAINVPLIPGKLAVRAVVGYARLGGFVDLLSGQENVNYAETQSYRFKIHYKPVDDLRLKFAYIRSEIDTGGGSSARDDFKVQIRADDDRTMNIYNMVAEYQFPGFSLLNSAGYVDYKLAQRPSVASGAFVVFVDGTLKSFNEELRLASTGTGPWQWTAGAIYKDTKETSLQVPFGGPPFIPGYLDLKYRSKSYAMFGELTRGFSDGKFEITGGLRYFEDHFQAIQFKALFNRAPAPAQKTTFDKLTWRGLFTFKPQPDMTFYGSVSTGFRSGRNQSFSAVALIPTLPAITPDSLLTYEAGAKGRILNGALSYELAVYHTKWTDIQQGLAIPPGVAGYLNAGKASGMGADGSLTLRPTRGLELTASIGWNDLRLDGDVLQQGNVIFLKGARVNDSPEWTGSVGATVRTASPMSDVEFVASGNLAYTSKLINRTLTGTTVVNLQSDILTNLKTSIGLHAERWSVDLYCDNLLNENDAASGRDIIAGRLGEANRLRPRTIGLMGSFDF